MYRYLYLALLNEYRKKLKGKFKYFGLFYNQFLDFEKNEAIQYPAIAVEFGEGVHSYMSNRIKHTDLTITFHIVNSSLSNSRFKDKGQDDYLDDLNIMRDVHIVYNQFNKNKVNSGLTSDENYYSFGPLTRVSTERVNDIKNLIYTKVSYRLNFYDNSKNKKKKFIKFDTAGGSGNDYFLMVKQISFLLESFTYDFSEDYFV